MADAKKNKAIHLLPEEMKKNLQFNFMNVLKGITLMKFRLMML